MHLVPWWNPKLLNKFLPRVPECCYCNLATFFLEPSASQGVQAQGHVFCPELQLRNNTTGKSSDHQKKKKKKVQQTKLEASADPTTRAVSAPAGWLEPVRDAGLKNPPGNAHKAGWSWGSEPLPAWLSSWSWQVFLKKQHIFYKVSVLWKVGALWFPQGMQVETNVGQNTAARWMALTTQTGSDSVTQL